MSVGGTGNEEIEEVPGALVDPLRPAEAVVGPVDGPVEAVIGTGSSLEEEEGETF